MLPRRFKHLVGFALGAISTIGLALLISRESETGLPLSPSPDPAPPVQQEIAYHQDDQQDDVAFRTVDTVDSLPSSIRPICGMEEDCGYSRRIAAVRALSDELSEVEVAGLIRFLVNPHIPVDVTALQLRVIKNDVLNVLRMQKSPPAELIDAMTSMFRDRRHDIAVRDYAVQHLAGAYDTAGVQRPDILAVFKEALRETDSSIAGTALLALWSVNRSHGDVDSAALADDAVDLALDPAVGAPARVTAIQIAAQMNDHRVLDMARDIALNGTALSLRISAIAALGSLGKLEDGEFLQRLMDEGDSHIQPAVRSAMKKLLKRHGEGRHS